jgi:hypothetical protein
MASPSARESHLYHVFELIDRLFSTHTAAAATQEFRDFNIPEVVRTFVVLCFVSSSNVP